MVFLGVLQKSGLWCLMCAELSSATYYLGDFYVGWTSLAVMLRSNARKLCGPQLMVSKMGDHK